MPALPPFQFQALESILRSQQLATEAVSRYAASGRGLSQEVATFDTGGTVHVPPVSSYPALRYIRMNNLVVVWFDIIFGAGTVFNGGPQYLILPYEVSPTINFLSHIGTWTAHDDNTGNEAQGAVRLAPPSPTQSFAYFTYLPSGASPSARADVSNTAPWTWATNDYLTGVIAYEAADGYSP